MTGDEWVKKNDTKGNMNKEGKRRSVEKGNAKKLNRDEI
jgi:hypothetical protein